MAALQRRLSDVGQDLNQLLESGDPRVPGEGALVVRVANNGIRSWPEHRLLYYPQLQATAEPSLPAFSAADELEFRRRDYAGAISTLRPLTSDADPNIRSAAINGIGRNLLHQGDYTSALQTYNRLAAEDSGVVGGIPAPFAALLGKLSVLDGQEDRSSAVSIADELQQGLQLSRFPISAATYQYLQQEVSRYVPDAQRRIKTLGGDLLAEGTQWIWEQWTGDPAWRAHGRASIVTKSGTSLIVWLVSHNVLVAYIVDAQQIQAEWLAQMKQLQSGQIGIALVSTDGRYVVGHAGESPARPTIRLASTTDLPWNLEVFRTGDIDTGWRARRNLLAAGIAVLFALILTGAWFVGRSVNRELAVARLQSDFVAAVSHEFRTPLTALCQLSELLKRGRVASDQDRLEYYELLYSESHRLHRLVEGLLNFGRLESGKLQYHFEDLDAAALVRESVDEFAATQQARGYHFELTTQAEPSVIPADREALGCVFWNLFENAVKYSPECETVWVNLAKNGKQVEIAVRDRGIGVGPRERHRIFGKFVRGSAARVRGIRGTGIGLALARQIVRAHGGDIKLETELGKGSTFRVLLPLSKV